MRLACFALTEKAYGLAVTFQRSLDVPVTIFVSEKSAANIKGSLKENVQLFVKICDAVEKAFRGYDGLIFIMAAGIAVRSIAPLLKSKLEDPAVVVFDECGQYGISLLSGHIGGANLLTQQLCQAVGALPVITTATDVNHNMAPDAVAARLSLRPWPKLRIQTLNSAVLRGERVYWRIDKTLMHSIFFKQQLEKEGQSVELCSPGRLFSVLPEERKQPTVVLVAEKDLPELSYLPANMLCMIPRRLIAGVGCKRGTPAALVMAALETACRMVGRDRSFLAALSSTTVKRHEAGILYAADSLGCPVYFYENDQMSKVIRNLQLEESPFVRETIGIGNVCEAAAYCCTGENGGRLALQKTKFEKVTVALVWEK